MDQTANGSRDTHCSQCDFEYLKRLYHLNTVAKQYANSAEKSYHTGLKRKARIHSQRKKALYNLKRSILGTFIQNGCVDDIRTHEIDNRTYYCIYVDEFSYHTPTSEWDDPPPDAPHSAVELDSFDADPSNRDNDMSEQETLNQLANKFGSPNYHIESPFAEHNYGGTFVGWSYLAGALEEGDRVPERYLHNHNGDDFLFEIGDRFQTSEGRCEITDRYYAYLTPPHDRSPLLQRPTYDVLLDDEKTECVSQRQINDGWWIVANSIVNPLPSVDGPLADMAGSAIETLVEDPIEFEIGDILELQPIHENESPMYCRLTEVHVSWNLLIGQYEPVPPSDDAPLGLSIEEIADDVVAVHDKPPLQE